MRRPWQVWFVFALSVAAMIPALLWLSYRTLALERDQLLVQAKAAQEENIASVLLRLDALVSPLLLRETSRPYNHYEPTYPLPVTNLVAGKNEDIVVAFASPLALEEQPDVLLHFEVFQDGVKTSPEAVADDLACNEKTQIPPEKIQEYRRRFNLIAQSIDYHTLATRLSQTAPPSEGDVFANYSWQVKVSNLESQRQQRMFQQGDDPQSESTPSQSFYAQGAQAGAPPPQMLSPSSDEQRNRAAYNQESRSKLPLAPPNPFSKDPTAQMAAAPSEVVREGRWEPLWHQEKLFLVRQVQRRGLESLQVCWLDWQSLRPRLLEEARSLIPEANLRPVDTRDPDEKLSRLHLMAALPLSLDISPPVVSPSPFSPTLVMAWAGFTMAAAVVGLLLYSVISLSEQRAAFVTSVTHELRTPLTTFRMYAEMLAEGMVTDEASRRRYLETLRVEADRLGHLVENVLSYARLERGRVGNVRERVEIARLLRHVVARLTDRAHQSGKQLEIEAPQESEQLAVRTDPGAVEQIVMNLIDNACKYAEPASDPRIIVSYGPAPTGKGVQITVRDFGPGIVKRPFRSRFRAFSKTAQEAAISAPGVGLGLALCRRLARQLDGQLTYRNAEGGGALLELRLP